MTQLTVVVPNSQPVVLLVMLKVGHAIQQVGHTIETEDVKYKLLLFNYLFAKHRPTSVLGCYCSEETP